MTHQFFASASSAVAVGPGWFDSSLDLRSGLDVVEEDRADLELRSWIDDFLGRAPAQPWAARVASPSAIAAIA